MARTRTVGVRGMGRTAGGWERTGSPCPAFTNMNRSEVCADLGAAGVEACARGSLAAEGGRARHWLRVLSLRVTEACSGFR